MPKISQYTQVQSVNSNDKILLNQTVGAETDTYSASIEQVGDNIAGTQQHVDLETNDQTIIGGINENKGKADDNAEAIGSLSQLTTTDKSSLVGAVNEVVSDKADKASLASILAPTNRLTSSHNMNSVDVGTYYQSDVSMPTNAPSGGYNGYIVVCKVRATDRIQFWYSINTSKLYYRSTASWSNGSSSSWSNWVTITAS